MRLTIGDPVPHPDVQVLYALDRESENEEGVPVVDWDRLASGYWRGEIGGEVRNLSFRELLELVREVWTSGHEAEHEASRAVGSWRQHPNGWIVFESTAELAEHDAQVRASAEAAVRESLAGTEALELANPDPEVVRQMIAARDRLESLGREVPSGHQVTDGFRDLIQDVAMTWDRDRGSVSPDSPLRDALDRLAGAVRAVWGA